MCLITDGSIMLLNIFTLLAKDKPLWVDFVGLLIPVGLAAWGFIRAFRAWERQKKREIELQFSQRRYEKKLEASQGVWPLLAYLSFWENEKSVFVKRKKVWYFRKEQGRDYLKALPEAFFDKGYGVFMPADVRDNLYHFRGIVYKLLHAASFEQDDNNEVRVKEQNIADSTVKELFDKTNASLRKMLVDSNIEFKD